MTKIKCLLTYVKKRLPILLLILVAATCVATGAVYAKYVTDLDSDVSVNISSTGDIEISVVETDDYTFTIENVTTAHETPAYIRFAIIVNWADNNGNLYYANPSTVGITVANDVIEASCTKLGDYYYYNGIVPVDAKIPEIRVAVVGTSAPTGYPNLRVTVLAEGIQCWPDAVVEDAWNVAFNGTKWIAK